MAGDQTSYRTAIAARPSEPERILRLLLAEFTAWAGPTLYRAGKFALAELARGVIALAALGFAVVAAAYGIVYFFRFLTELLANWMPHWAALLTTSTLMLIPAGLAALFGLWQIYRMRSVRATVTAAVRAGDAVRGRAPRGPASRR
ncbi:phage holin family protein [Nocardia sp. NPDC056100]|uniref:phage holin family protein n=1 Tax=Nocardia sp. NPDC056100 TaxID=3345712 RepID=UPI0035DFB925